MHAWENKAGRPGRDIGTAQSKSGAPRAWSASFLIEPRQYPVYQIDSGSLLELARELAAEGRKEQRTYVRTM